MKLARVAGSVVSTLHHSEMQGHRLLLCDLLDGLEAPTGSYTLAVDQVDAGPGDMVLILDEGSSARLILDQEGAPIRAVIVGIVDRVSLAQSS